MLNSALLNHLVIRFRSLDISMCLIIALSVIVFAFVLIGNRQK